MIGRGVGPAVGGTLVAVLLAGVWPAAPAAAQTGLGLKAHLVYNASTARTFQDDRDRTSAGDFVGFNLGAEYLLPFGVAVGVSGYASGDPRDTDRATVFMVLAEANYHVELPMLPITPFAGAHIGLGTFSWDVRDEALNGDFGDLDRARLGWQLGLRVRLLRGLAVEGQYRRLSARAESSLNPGFEADQVLLGVRLF